MSFVYLLTIIPFILFSPVFAETFVSVPVGTSVPGCEDTNECFIPPEISVGVGETVTWSNVDTAAHTVTSGSKDNGPDGIFDSSLFMAGSSFSVQFDKSGSYPYFCMVHPWMVGVVIVGDGVPEPIPEPIPPDNERINELETENQNLRNEISILEQTILDLEKKVNDLNQIIMEQIKVIYEWVISR